VKGVAVLVTALALAAPAAAVKGPPASNQLVLTRKQSQRLVAYAGAMRTCLVRSGVDVAPLHATRKLISLPIRGASTTRELMSTVLGCADRVGDPPKYASLQTFSDRIVLYSPKQCLIDKKVVAGVR
jgi:hypothetical protein